jgi:hypothetical protein
LYRLAQIEPWGGGGERALLRPCCTPLLPAGAPRRVAEGQLLQLLEAPDPTTCPQLAEAFRSHASELKTDAATASALRSALFDQVSHLSAALAAELSALSQGAPGGTHLAPLGEGGGNVEGEQHTRGEGEAGPDTGRPPDQRRQLLVAFCHEATVLREELMGEVQLLEDEAAQLTAECGPKQAPPPAVWGSSGASDADGIVSRSSISGHPSCPHASPSVCSSSTSELCAGALTQSDTSEATADNSGLRASYSTASNSADTPPEVVALLARFPLAPSTLKQGVVEVHASAAAAHRRRLEEWRMAVTAKPAAAAGGKPDNNGAGTCVGGLQKGGPPTVGPARLDPLGHALFVAARSQAHQQALAARAPGGSSPAAVAGRLTAMLPGRSAAELAEHERW